MKDIVRDKKKEIHYKNIINNFNSYSFIIDIVYYIWSCGLF